jgi:hypothetical protein
MFPLNAVGVMAALRIKQYIITFFEYLRHFPGWCFTTCGTGFITSTLHVTEYDSAVSSVVTEVKGIATTCGNYTPSIVGCDDGIMCVCGTAQTWFSRRKRTTVCIFLLHLPEAAATFVFADVSLECSIVFERGS